MVKLRKGKKVGLALGGGAVLGAAHIGVLRALKEHDIEIGWITGTSIGALVASLYVFDKDFDKVSEIAIDLNWKKIGKISLSRYGLFSNKKIKRFLDEAIGEVTFEQAGIPLAFVATNILNSEKVVLNKGDIAEAVMASTCIPGIFKPVKHNGMLLVDGGIVENVPVPTLRDMGAGRIIAVDLNARYTYKKPENILQVLANSFHYTLMHAAKAQSGDADILIQPDLSGFNRIDTHQTPGLIEKGYEEAKKVLKEELSKKSWWG
jgi:NTE family protein